jgi:hypothetical protein
MEYAEDEGWWKINIKFQFVNLKESPLIPRCRWEANVMMELQEIESKRQWNMMHVTLNGVHWAGTCENVNI